MKIEDIFQLLGNFGRYQFFVVAYLCVATTLNCLTTLSNVFMSAKSDHWCSVFPEENCSSWEEFANNCTDVRKEMGVPKCDRDNCRYPYSNCEQFDLPDDYSFNPYAANNDNYSLVPCIDGWEYDTSQYRTTTISDFGLVCDQSGAASYAQSIYFVGFLIAAFIFGTISDWVGRKKAIFIGLLFWSSSFIVTSFSVNIYMFTAMRFLSGFGLNGVYIATFVLALEVVGRSYRTAVTMVAGIFFSLGYFILATVAMYVSDWRLLCRIVSIPTLLMFLPLPFIQESTRWLISKGRITEAEIVLRRIAKVNRKTLPNVLIDEEDVIGETESKESAVPPSVIDLYRTPNMAAKTVNLQYNWVVNSLVYFGLSQSTGDLGVDVYWAFFVSGAVEIPGLIYALIAVEKLGRKWNTAALEVIGGIACLATIFLPAGIPQTAVSMIGKFCISTSFSIIYLYSTELFPTPVRAIGLGVCSLASRIGGIISPIILLLGSLAPNLPLVLFGSSSVLAGLLALFLPETRNQKLPQTLKEGEEFGKCSCMRKGTEDYEVGIDAPENVKFNEPRFQDKDTSA